MQRDRLAGISPSAYVAMPRPGPRRELVFVRLLPDALKWVDAQAKTEGQTRSGMLRKLLGEAMAARLGTAPTGVEVMGIFVDGKHTPVSLQGPSLPGPTFGPLKGPNA